MSGGILTVGARAAVLVADAANAFDSVAKTLQSGELKAVHGAAAVNRLVLLSFSVAENVMLARGKKSELLYKLKTYEVLPRGINLPLQVLLKTVCSEESNLRGFLRLFEKGFVAPMADLLRVAAEGQAYYEKHFLEMSPEDLRNAERPIYEIEGSGQDRSMRIVGYEPVDPKKCEQNLAREERNAAVDRGVRLFAEAGGAEILISDVGLPLYERLALFLASRSAQVQRPRPLMEGEREIEALLVGEENFHFPQIPLPLHQDQVFRRFICPISSCPIRDPVRDPTNGITLYERSEIVRWIHIHHNSPITRQPLAVCHLQEAPAIRRIIDYRLRQHTEGLLQYLRERAEAPLDNPRLQQILDQFEDPGRGEQ